jgi:hypothetical protein
MLKLDANANHQWLRSMGSISIDRGYSVTIDLTRNAYVTGYYSGTVDFDPDIPTVNLTAKGDDDVLFRNWMLEEIRYGPYP